MDDLEAPYAAPSSKKNHGFRPSLSQSHPGLQNGLPATASLRLPDEIAQRLNRLADRTGRSKTFYMQAAILEHLDDLEDLYLAEQRLIDIQAGKSQAVPLEEVMERYGLEDRA